MTNKVVMGGLKPTRSEARANIKIKYSARLFFFFFFFTYLEPLRHCLN